MAKEIIDYLPFPALLLCMVAKRTLASQLITGCHVTLTRLATAISQDLDATWTTSEIVLSIWAFFN